MTSDFLQFAQPLSFWRMMSLHRRQKLLGLVIGVPSTWIISDATPVARAKSSWRRWISSRLNSVSKLISSILPCGWVRASRFDSRACSIFLRSVISRKVTTAPVIIPSRRTGWDQYSTGKLLPSGCQNTSLLTWISSSVFMARMMGQSSSG